MRKDHYKTLDLTLKASDDEIRSAYRRLAPLCHPDLNPRDPDAKTTFERLDEAYKTLKEPKRRIAYDEEYRTWGHVGFRFMEILREFRRGASEATAPIVPPPLADLGLTYRWGPDGTIIVEKLDKLGTTIVLQG